MAIIRKVHDKENPYAQISRKTLQNNDISFTARGVLSYLLSLPDNWQINTSKLYKIAKEGRRTIQKVIQELEEHGFLKKTPNRLSDGTLRGWVFDFYEEPRSENTQPTEPPETPLDGKPPDGNRSFGPSEEKKERTKERKEYIIYTNTNATKGGCVLKIPKNIKPKPDLKLVRSNIYLTENEQKDLESKLGKTMYLQLLEELEDYILSHGKKYQDHAAVLRTWYRNRLSNKPSMEKEIIYTKGNFK